jgi:hypothetical protein
MIIETKYSIDEEVYLIYNNKIILGKITGIQIIKSNNLCSWSNNLLKYCINGLPIKQEMEMYESGLFKTKEELIASL